ncbi:MAG: hypothetical protein DMD26_18620 [Gemmatimonadetes bacterium]|nr:MAG: hypothetical protein DMD26_18620 [Gemmatimonadota bacterium]
MTAPSLDVTEHHQTRPSPSPSYPRLALTIALALYAIPLMRHPERGSFLDVGGGEHDWAFLLGRFGLLAHDQGIGWSVHALGAAVCLVSVTAGLVFSSRAPLAKSAELAANGRNVGR